MSRESIFGESRKEVYHIGLRDNHTVVVNWEIYDGRFVLGNIRNRDDYWAGSEGDVVSKDIYCP